MQHNDIAFPFFTASELTALITDPELDNLLRADPLSLGGEQFHLPHRIWLTLNELNRACPTRHTLHAAGEYVLADETGNRWNIHVTDSQHDLVRRAAEVLETSEANVIALIMSHEGLDLMYDSWVPASIEDSVPPASPESSRGYRPYAPPYPFVSPRQSHPSADGAQGGVRGHNREHR